jgi:PAS domain S-box-containing protein
MNPDPLWQHQIGLLLESTGEGIFGIDLEGHCTFINRAGANILGYEASHILGKNMHWLTHHSHPDGSHYADTDCPIFRAFRQGLPCRVDTEVFWKCDGSSFPVEYSSHPIMQEATVLGAVITFIDITERKQAADLLHRAKEELEQSVADRTRELSATLEQLRELTAYSERVREDERTRIAREIHDELGSLLVALKMDISWIDKRLTELNTTQDSQQALLHHRLHNKCKDMSGLIENAVHNVGRIITDLRPSILDHQGLWAALEWQAQEFVKSSEIKLNLVIQVQAAQEPSQACAMAVFRIFQEMLSNVGRHASASQLDVKIIALPDMLTIVVQDNGKGAATAQFDANGAYGVMGMRERARPYGGSILIQSQVNHGTRIELRLPL